MAAPWQPPSPTLSALAKKYNHPVGGRHDDLYGSTELKSGLTPLNLGPFERYEDVHNLQRWKTYQRERFEGFLTNELEALETLAPLFHDGQLPTLDGVPIHPLLVRKQWYMKIGRHQAPYPIKRGNDGFWHASNDGVWNAMVPALKVVSLYLTDGPLLGWIDALLFGQLEPIPRGQIPDEQDFHNRKFYRVRLRRLEVIKAQRGRVLEKLIEVAKNVELGLVSGFNDTMTGVPESSGITLGKTFFNMTWYDKTKIFVAIEMVEPLLRTDLTVAEHAVETFRLASIITHEIAHLLWLERAPDRVTRHTEVDEPYFENEVCAELGFSFQNALFGGIPHEFVSMEDPRPEFGIPAAGMYKSSWNNITFHNYNRFFPTLLILPPNYFRRDRWPIPVMFFVNLCQQQYWETYVRAFGEKATRMGPLTEGSRDQFPPAQIQVRRRLVNRKPVPPVVSIGDSLSEGEQTALEFHNQQNARARHIRDQLQTYTNSANAIMEAQQDMILSGQAIPPPPGQLPGYPSCTRYVEIQDYLFANRLELALDTLNFKMPEHVMFAHISRNGGLDITADEWRAFLEVCDFRRVLFKHTNLGTGCLERIEAGWPTDPLRSRPIWPKPERSIREHFLVVARSALTVPYVFAKGYLDHDKSQFRQICIASKANFTPPPEKRRICEFGPVTFEALLYWCHQENRVFTYGPEGVIRLLKNTSNPASSLDPPSYIESQKGKKILGKRCPQM